MGHSAYLIGAACVVKSASAAVESIDVAKFGGKKFVGKTFVGEAEGHGDDHDQGNLPDVWRGGTDRR
jgi:hypothetical protein